jgi:hypothetical protein
LMLWYILTNILLKLKVLSLLVFRKIWNIILLITFLVSWILGILLIIQINIHTYIWLPFNILFRHVEFWIVMFIVCMFHVIERRNYFKNIFIKKTKN